MKRAVILNVRLSNDEAQEAKEAAEKQLITVSSFMRQAVVQQARRVNGRKE